MFEVLKTPPVALPLFQSTRLHLHHTASGLYKGYIKLLLLYYQGREQGTNRGEPVPLKDAIQAFVAISNQHAGKAPGGAESTALLCPVYAPSQSSGVYKHADTHASKKWHYNNKVKEQTERR
ncbi:Hypothetical predicted protein [Xyrichtys novacula]|uniref:Uncharacterized protein n=1 Tax=Xyrichtys novacula TaxID=13765 RepID=A0AAV1GV76_XYRNO|nr:Hypothetical predicted protein [Xyrichtys novacula]